jgi:hypothetical protein
MQSAHYALIYRTVALFSPPKAQHRAARAPVITSPGPSYKIKSPARAGLPLFFFVGKCIAAVTKRFPGMF